MHQTLSPVDTAITAAGRAAEANILREEAARYDTLVEHQATMATQHGDRWIRDRYLHAAKANRSLAVSMRDRAGRLTETVH
jgi:hypothetical protein